MKLLKKIIVGVLLCAILSFSCSAKVYDETFPEDSLLSYPCWIDCEVDGVGHCYLFFCDCFKNISLSFTNYELAGFRFLCCFDKPLEHVDGSPFGYLSLPGTDSSYELIKEDVFLYIRSDDGILTDLNVLDVYDTNLNILDPSGVYSNDYFRFSQTDKILIFIGVVLVSILLFYILRSAFRA